MDEISFHRMLKVMEAQGIVLQDMGRHEAALCALRRAVALTPKTESSTDPIKARIFFSISRSGMALEEPETVHDALDASQRNGHDIGLILNVKGLLARSQMRHADALKYLTKSIRRNPLEARYAAQCICNKSLHIQFDDDTLSICCIFLHEFSSVHFRSYINSSIVHLVSFNFSNSQTGSSGKMMLMSWQVVQTRKLPVWSGATQNQNPSRSVTFKGDRWTVV